MRVLTYTGPRSLTVETVEDIPLKPHQCRIRSMFSGISHGTEMSAYRGIAPFFTLEMDPETRLFHEIEADKRLKYPIRSCDEEAWFMGYSNVGMVIEVGEEVEGFAVGDIVFSHGRHQTIVNKNHKKIFKIPDGLRPELAVFFTNLVTAYNAVLDTRLKVGDTVVVLGLGVVGQLIAQIAKKSGASVVVGVDLYEHRLEVAKANGLDVAINPNRVTDVALETRKYTSRKGADAVFEASGNAAALNEAVRIAAPDTTVTAVGWYHGTSQLMLAEEFHQNRITIRASQTLGIDPSIRHTYDDDRKRKVARRLLTELQLENLISHRIPFEEAPKAYEMIDTRPQDVLQVLLVYE